MIKGILIDFGGTIDSDGIHWFDAFREAYALMADVPHELLWDAYVHTERTLGGNPIITPDFTFRQTLQVKLFLQAEYLKSKDILISDDAQSTLSELLTNRNILRAQGDCWHGDRKQHCDTTTADA